jgi:hypothetical protein
MTSEELQKKLHEALLKALEGQKPTEQDKSIMIKLTPLEVFNMVKLGATYWENAQKNNTHLSKEEVCKHHAEFALNILSLTDPDRFIYQS